MAELPLYSSLREELDSPPKISIQIIGSKLTDEQVKEIDFDLWVDCTKMVGIKSIKASTSTEELCHTWQNPSKSQDNPEDMLERWLNYWLNDCAETDKSWTLHKSVSFAQEELGAMKFRIKLLAREAYYRGSIEVILHAPSSEPDYNPLGYESADNARLQVEWSFECPFKPTDHNSNSILQYAMKLRKKGWVDLNGPTPTYGQCMLRRAPAYDSLDDSTIRDRLLWLWGRDGPP
ncbi:hypothetical protein AtubIFM57258_000880 [Aspergillus tubingensis]|nr:hypothetical protein AtubIFM57258_000880 [Aspergillus tubingensis]